MNHEYWMSQALEAAGQAFKENEVPVGAIIICDEQRIVCTHNQVEQTQDPTAHAELIAIRLATDILQVKWLIDCTLYVTLEPCAMCAGAILASRLKRLVFGAPDPKHGACGSLENLLQDPRRNHRVEIVSGVHQPESQKILREFFANKRSEGCQSG